MSAEGSPVVMSSRPQPLVGVVTPVYNGEDFLAECIESLRRQTYPYWQYLIVNNCSTDRTREIAERFAALDGRIRLHNQDRFVSSMENHNFGFQAITPEAKYCKVVHADDWLFPECLEKMVGLAEAHPSVGVVAAYGLAMDRVVWDGLPLDHAASDGPPWPSAVIPGREICRRHLLGGSHLFGSPTSVLFRADLVRKRRPFYREQYPHWADLDACLEVLRESDFGFVYQVLTFTRFHHRAGSWSMVDLNGYITGQLEVMQRHGPIHLDRDSYRRMLREILKEYRRFLGQSVFRRPRDREFWKYHLESLRALGHPMTRVGLTMAAAAAVFEVLSYPARTVGDVLAGALGGRRRRQAPARRLPIRT